jgi:hypothetical protein
VRDAAEKDFRTAGILLVGHGTGIFPESMNIIMYRS